MIKKLRRKFVLIVMIVVALILLAIFSTMILSAQKNNERISIGMLHQALSARTFPNDGKPPLADTKPFLSEGPRPNMRLSVLVAEIDEYGSVSVISNQLHFIEEKDIAPIVELAFGESENIGILSGYALRYLKESTRRGMRIAFADISMEQEILKTQIANSLLIGGAAMLVFFLLSLFLARWAVRPVEVAWKQQKQFIANASHELKTPLTVILSNADMLQGEKTFENDKDARRMEHIHAEALRMKQLVEDMLTLARSEDTERTMINSVVDFSYLVKSAVLTYEPVVYDEGKQLSSEIEGHLSVRGDAVGLQQVVCILLDNARKYSAPGGAIRVSLSREDHKSLRLKVSNEGVPIPKDELEDIFLRFYRRDESRSEHGSFGLGLSIAQSIVGSHKGRIWAESDEKLGNIFYVSLPLAQ